jgi:hypothetical protein
VFHRDIECGAIDACLSAGNNFHPASETISRLRANGLKFVPRS